MRDGPKLRLAPLLTFSAILAMHVLGLLLLPTLRRPFLRTPRDELSTTMAFLEPGRQQPTQTTKLHAPSAPKRQPARASVRGTEPKPETAERENTAPVAIDWAQEAERAVAHRIQADEQAVRRASALLPRPRVGAPDAHAMTPKFGWDDAHIHRIVPIPDGGWVVNLNDRCAIVVKFPFLLPACRIGKIDSRGDLFIHMKDAPILGARARQEDVLP